MADRCKTCGKEDRKDEVRRDDESYPGSFNNPQCGSNLPPILGFPPRKGWKGFGRPPNPLPPLKFPKVKKEPVIGHPDDEVDGVYVLKPMKLLKPVDSGNWIWNAIKKLYRRIAGNAKDIATLQGANTPNLKPNEQPFTYQPFGGEKVSDFIGKTVAGALKIIIEGKTKLEQWADLLTTSVVCNNYDTLGYWRKADDGWLEFYVGTSGGDEWYERGRWNVLTSELMPAKTSNSFAFEVPVLIESDDYSTISIGVQAHPWAEGAPALGEASFYLLITVSFGVVRFKLILDDSAVLVFIDTGYNFSKDVFYYIRASRKNWSPDEIRLEIWNGKEKGDNDNPDYSYNTSASAVTGSEYMNFVGMAGTVPTARIRGKFGTLVLEKT